MTKFTTNCLIRRTEHWGQVYHELEQMRCGRVENYFEDCEECAVTVLMLTGSECCKW